MSYSHKTLSAMEKAADSVPISIQLEVNTEIFVTVRNLLFSFAQDSWPRNQDIQRLNELIQTTLTAQAEIEERRGFGFDWQTQATMLSEAIAIQHRYVPQITFYEVAKPADHLVFPKAHDTFSRIEADQIFTDRIWPFLTTMAPANESPPTAYLIGGQPGSGKTRMAATILQTHPLVIHGDADSLMGFHPQYRQLQEKYGLYSIYITRPFADYIADLVLQRAVAERRSLLLESNLTDRETTLTHIAYLHKSGYRVVVILRACPRNESWTNLQQLYQQQLIKAPALARMISPEQHDRACDAYVETALAIRKQHLFDQLIIRSNRGLLYDSDDMPTENVAELLRERLNRNE